MKQAPSSTNVAADQREFPRVSSRCLVDCRPVGDDPKYQAMREQSQGLLQNISGGGVCIRMTEEKKQGELLALNILLPNMPTAVIALGKVCWCRPAEGEFDLGIEFWWIGWQDPSAQERIRDFISGTLDESPD